MELYDLDADLGEKKDLASDLPKLAAKLRAQLEAWLDDTIMDNGVIMGSGREMVHLDISPPASRQI